MLTPLPDDTGDLRSLVEDYERRLIVSALSACGGQKTRAAAALGVLPTTLHEKMKRLSIVAAAGEPPPGATSFALRSPADEFRWRGRMARGSALEVRGISGGVRASLAEGEEVEVVAVRSARTGAGHLALSVLEHESGAVFSVHETRSAASPATQKCRVDFELRVPEGVSLVVRLLSGSIEIAGLRGEVEAHTLSGQVRFVTARRQGPVLAFASGA